MQNLDRFQQIITDRLAAARVVIADFYTSVETPPQTETKEPTNG